MAVLKQKLHYLTRHTSNLPKFSTFHTQNSISKLLSSPETLQSPISNLIPRTDPTFLLQKHSNNPVFLVRRNVVAARLLPAYEYDPCRRMGGVRSSSSSTGIAQSPVQVSSGSSDHGWRVYAPFLLWISIVIAALGLGSRRQESRNVVSGEETSVTKIQVCLLVTPMSLQKDLNQIVKVADTSTTEGLSNVLRETEQALLRYPDGCIYFYYSVKEISDDREKRSIEEHVKLDEEILVNLNNLKRKMESRKPQNSETPNEYIVITVLVSAEGTHKLQWINSSSDLKEALQQLGSISSREIRAAEVLWIPQEEIDTLLE